MNSEKISQALAESMRNASDGDILDVIVELDTHPAPEKSGASREDKIRARKTAFAQQSAPVTGAIHKIGGEVTGEAWINGSLRARLSPAMIPALMQHAEIARLDTPHKLQADAVKS